MASVVWCWSHMWVTASAGQISSATSPSYVIRYVIRITLSAFRLAHLKRHQRSPDPDHTAPRASLLAEAANSKGPDFGDAAKSPSTCTIPSP